jgi:hypothetical protein
VVGPSVGLAVQSLDTARPLPIASHATYTGPGRAAGRSTEAAAAAPAWYLAEGHVGSYFEEILAVASPGPRPVRVVIEGYGAAGLVGTETRWIPTGPGQVSLRLNDLGWVTGDHSTIVRGFEAGTGAPAPIVVERTLRWAYGDGRETHSSPGVAAPAMTWDFAEGNQGTFDTYLLVFNPAPTATPVRVYDRHENGGIYQGDVTVPGQSRVTVLTPAWVPAGSYGATVSTFWSTQQPIVVERAVYGNPDWSVGTCGVGSPQRGRSWQFAEGWAPYDSFFLVLNPWGPAATATFTFTQDDGTVRTASLWVPAGARATLDARTVPGLSGGYRTEVTTEGDTLVVERALYWPGTGGGSAAMSGEPSAAAEAAAPGTEDVPGVAGGDSTTTGPPGTTRPQPYTVLGVVEPVGTVSLARAAGTVSVEEVERLAAVAAMRQAVGAAAGVTTLTSPSLPWYGGHVVLGRAQ